MDSWESLKQAKKLDEVGLRTFKNLFTLSPRLLSLFSFRDHENLYRSEALKSHYEKVLNQINTAIYQVVESKDLKQTLKEVGRGHRVFGVQKQQFEMFAQSFIQALESVLKDKFTP